MFKSPTLPFYSSSMRNNLTASSESSFDAVSQQVLEQLLSLEATDADERDWLQQTALHVAAFAGNPDVVSYR